MTKELAKILKAYEGVYAIELPYKTTHELIRDFIEYIEELKEEIKDCNERS